MKYAANLDLDFEMMNLDRNALDYAIITMQNNELNSSQLKISLIVIVRVKSLHIVASKERKETPRLVTYSVRNEAVSCVGIVLLYGRRRL